jgi:M6 family metalloprotease-like protein
MFTGVAFILVVVSILIFLPSFVWAYQSNSRTFDRSLSSSGHFNIVWGDGKEGETQTLYTLTEDTGQVTPLLLDESLSRSMGGVLQFDRKRVNVPWVSIMCKFIDFADEPKDLAYFTGMYANTEPGMDHYWRELSYNTVNIAGSSAFGWFVLPQPESYYNPTDTTGGTNLNLLANDCIGAADSSVDFSPYSGINMMFNTDFDNGYAWGGSRWMTLDGVTKVWSVTWEPPWGYSTISVIAHEMGHGFGLPHSSGAYGQTYDNAWDVMSKDRYNCAAATDPIYGCMAQHTISYHKDILGWIPAGQKFTAASGTRTTITLEQLALPETTNYKMAQVPINGSSTNFYTVEVRRQTGYDTKVAGNAVIIHEVDTTRSRPAYVVDPDLNGVTGDAGAMWVVGETFIDETNNIAVIVKSATATGFEVTIENEIDPCSPQGVQHDLTTLLSPSGGGTIIPDCSGACTYDCLDTVDLTAAANSGYIFGGWSGGCSGIGACQVTMDRDKYVTANFMPSVESFESGFGVWSNVSGDDFDWTWRTGGTPSSGTGPSGAHDGSYYLYTEASSPNYPSKVAYLEATLDFSSLGSPSLEFYYHMYGNTMGTLYVDVFDGVWNNDVWSRTGQQHSSNGASWSLATVDLSAFAGSGSVTIRFRGVTGSNYRSDMAIDRVSILDDGVDDDGDGYYTGNDCDDSDPNNWTSCVSCADSDSDAYFVSCDAYTTINGPDCDDSDPAINPETYWYQDNDGDGFGNSSVYFQQCTQPGGPIGYVLNKLDYDDSDSDTGAPARIGEVSPTYYLTLQEAYDAAGDGDTIRCIEAAFTENLFLDIYKSINMEGGYDGAYSVQNGSTTLNGDIDVTNGAITLENFILQ